MRQSRRLSLFILVASLAGACGPDANSAASNLEEFLPNQLSGRSMPARTISLTFDDGPGPRTLELARYLNDQGIAATFFMEGDHLAARPHVAEEVVALGHRIANHSYSHPSDLPSMAADRALAQIVRTDALLRDYIDDDVFLFRAPYGNWNASMPAKLNRAGMDKYVGPIFWDAGGEWSDAADTAADWACFQIINGRPRASVAECARRYLSEIRRRGRGIVLMHDVHSSTIDMVYTLVPKLRDAGFDFLRLDEVPAIQQEIDASR